MADSVELHNRFAYHPPATSTVAHKHEDVREACWRLANYFNEQLPEGREKALAFTHIEDAMMWANAAIARSKTNVAEHGLEPDDSPAPLR